MRDKLADFLFTRGFHALAGFVEEPSFWVPFTDRRWTLSFDGEYWLIGLHKPPVYPCYYVHFLCVVLTVHYKGEAHEDWKRRRAEWENGANRPR